SPRQGDEVGRDLLEGFALDALIEGAIRLHRLAQELEDAAAARGVEDGVERLRFARERGEGAGGGLVVGAGAPRLARPRRALEVDDEDRLAGAHPIAVRDLGAGHALPA